MSAAGEGSGGQPLRQGTVVITCTMCHAQSNYYCKYCGANFEVGNSDSLWCGHCELPPPLNAPLPIESYFCHACGGPMTANSLPLNIFDWLCKHCHEARKERCEREIASIHAQPPPATIVLYLDCEGSANNVLELAFVIFKQVEDTDGEIICASVFYGQIANDNDFRRGRRLKHGLNRRQIQNKGKSQDSLAVSLRRAITLHDVGLIVGCGSVVPAFLRKHSIDAPDYADCPLPQWRERVTSPSHLRAREAKMNERRLPANGVRCRVRAMHDHHPMHFKSIETLQHRAQCALYDAYELCLRENPGLTD